MSGTFSASFLENCTLTNYIPYCAPTLLALRLAFNNRNEAADVSNPLKLDPYFSEKRNVSCRPYFPSTYKDYAYFDRRGTERHNVIATDHCILCFMSFSLLQSSPQK